MRELLGKYKDAFVPLSIIGIIFLMILPVPSVVIDLLLSWNIAISLMVLLIAMYITHPLDFSVLPSLLLLTTLYRLSLNIATTRLILLRGSEGPDAAGQVVKAFGNFVVGGNYIVGFIIFLILVVINFVVITRGSGRIAEVAARFTLDAMPGKQMSIDADLNAGLINEATARERRLKIAREADFYGAMDGASKFVRGDALAGVIIILINIFGGFTIGAFQQKLSLLETARNYTLLSVGDGLVSQIPALMISTSAGMVVTRAAADSNLGAEMAKQLFCNPRAIAVSAAALFILGLIPGLPQVPFLSLSALSGVFAYVTFKKEDELAKKEEMDKREEVKQKGAEGSEMLMPIDPLALEIGYGLIPIVDAEKNGDLLDRIKSIRRQFALDMGMVIPPIHIRDNMQLKPAEYVLLIKGVEVARGELLLNHVLALDYGGAEKQIEGIETKEPAFGLPALWIEKERKEDAQLAGYTVVDLSTVIATHLTEVVKRHAHELLDRESIQSLLDNLVKTNPKVIEELVPNLLSLGGVQKVLQNLLREGIPIRDLVTILETIADYAPLTKDPEILNEYVRKALSRTITRQLQDQDSTIPLLTIAPDLEEKIAKAIQHTEQGSYLALEPDVAQRLISKLTAEMDKFTMTSGKPVLLVSPVLRNHVRKLVERFIPEIHVISHNEIAAGAKVRTLAAVGL